MRWEVEKAMREASGYDFKPWEERQRESGVGDAWLASPIDGDGRDTLEIMANALYHMKEHGKFLGRMNDELSEFITSIPLDSDALPPAASNALPPAASNALPPAASKAITPEVVQPAAKGSISGVMRDVIQKMKESDVKSFSILASQLFETDWILERGKKYKGMTKEEAQAAFIQDFGQRMQDAQATRLSPVAAGSDDKPKKLSETLRGVIDAMKASDERLEDIGEQVFDLRRRAMDLELGDVGELPPPARKALVAAEVSNAPPFIFPGDLEKARPERQGNRELLFESDLDRIAYLLAKVKPGSKAATQFREALAAQGFDAEQVLAHGALVKKAVSKGVKESDIDPMNTPSVVNATDGGYARIPVQPFGGDTPRLPLPEQGRQAGKASQKVADLKDQINKGGCGL
jgi:hypothetical protein